ncbi:hypothetical protein [Rickettsiella endosymbiont of Dermanyssus gallinae]|uniref:hypothetical protein n=1 Tax=Rickettsiella endosymbiont of Dermanyssus gallinae TaxID=2856608 RepID=UPI001C52FB82|nr:hypothetical protein [Rickettsiella endosymbiont of Dermanyssus gallinae]
MKNQHCFDEALKHLDHFSKEDLQAYVNDVLTKAKSYDSLRSQAAINRAIKAVNQAHLQSFFENALVTQNNIRKFDALAKTLKEKSIDLRSIIAQRYTNLADNLPAHQKAAQQRLFKSLFQGMSDEELSFLQNKDSDISIARALDGKAAPELAKKLAKRIEDYIKVRNPELIISNALRLREVNTDRFVRAVHDQGLVNYGGRSAGNSLKNLFKNTEDKAKLFKASKLRWTQFIKSNLDLEKTFVGTDAIDTEGNIIHAEIDKRLDSIFNNIITGKSEIFTRSEVANDREAVKRKSRLFFYWKDHESFLNYSREYGKGNLFQALVGDLNASSSRIGLAELMGDSPLSVYNDLRQVQQEKNPKGALWYKHTEMVLKQALQQDQTVVSPTLAAFGANTRSLGAIARLPTIVLRSIPDASYIASFAQRWGNDYFKSLAYTLGHTFDRFTDAERTFIAKQFKLLADSHLGYMARFADLTNGTELVHKVTTGFFRANLLESFDKGNRHSLMHLIAKGLYEQRNRSWKSLKIETRFQLEKYGLNQKEWDLLRTKNQQGLFTTANVDAVTDAELKQLYGSSKPFYEMRNDLTRKVFSIFSTVADNAVLVPDNFTKAFMYYGTRPGTVLGEIMRMVMQFKGFAINFADKVLLQGYQDARNTQMRLRWGLSLVAGTLPLSYLSNYFDNLAHGKSMPLFSAMNRQEKTDYLINLVQPNLGIFMQVFDPKYQDKKLLQNLFSSPSINFLSSVGALGASTVTLNPKKAGKNLKNMAKNILPIDTMPVIGPYFNQLLGDKSYLEPGQKMYYGQ